MNCVECKERATKKADVPYIVHESEMARQERNNKRLLVVIIMLIILLFDTNIAWAVHNYNERQSEKMIAYEMT